MILGKKIKRLRLACDLTQEELADRCELTKGYISQLENDLTSPSIATLIDILNALGTDLKEFFSEMDTEEKISFNKTEFIEKAVRFYCGYLLNNEHTATEFIAPQLAAITEGIVRGSEQNLSRAMFKIAVELGALTHMLAAMNDVDDATLYKLRLMCSDEVKRINGIINFEKAVR